MSDCVGRLVCSACCSFFLFRTSSCVGGAAAGAVAGRLVGNVGVDGRGFAGGDFVFGGVVEAAALDDGSGAGSPSALGFLLSICVIGGDDLVNMLCVISLR